MTPTKTKAKRITVARRSGPRDVLEVPEKYKRSGFRYRWVRMGDSPTETEGIIEEYQDGRGMSLVTKDGKEGGPPVQHRNMILFAIDEKTYHQRQEDKVKENVRQNKAQAEDMRRQLRSRMSPTGERPRLLERGVERGAREPLLTKGESFENEPEGSPEAT